VTNNAARRLISFLICLVAGFGGFLAGAFLGAAAGRFITGEPRLHGLDVITLSCMVVGMFAGKHRQRRRGEVAASRL
jgi:hypothetical protein